MLGKAKRTKPVITTASGNTVSTNTATVYWLCFLRCRTSGTGTGCCSTVNRGSRRCVTSAYPQCGHTCLSVCLCRKDRYGTNCTRDESAGRPMTFRPGLKTFAVLRFPARNEIAVHNVFWNIEKFAGNYWAIPFWRIYFVISTPYNRSSIGKSRGRRHLWT